MYSFCFFILSIALSIDKKDGRFSGKMFQQDFMISNLLFSVENRYKTMSGDIYEKYIIRN